MFVLVARYIVDKEVQDSFCHESRAFFDAKLKQSPGFVRLRFLRNLLSPEYVDVVTEWRSEGDFIAFLRKNPVQPALLSPHKVLDRFLLFLIPLLGQCWVDRTDFEDDGVVLTFILA